MSWIAFTGQARLPEASSAGTNPFRLCTMVFHFPNAPPTRPQTLLGLPVFLGQISGERRTGSEHKHCFIQSNGGRVLVQKGMSNSLLVTCIAVQLFERGLERCMFQQPALFKGVQRRGAGGGWVRFGVRLICPQIQPLLLLVWVFTLTVFEGHGGLHFDRG